MDKVKHRIYVSLDALLDTRLALIAQHSPAIVGELLHSGRWHSRQHNDPARLDSRLAGVDWTDAWNKRTADLLPQSGMTYVPGTIRRLVLEYDVVGPRMGMEAAVELTINTYPYILTEEERGYFRDVFMIHFGCTSVELVHFAIEHLTLASIDLYDTVIMNDFDAWHTKHSDSLAGNALSRTKVSAPLLLTRESPPMPPEMLARAAGVAFQELFILELVPVKEFSLIAQGDVETKDSTPPPQ